MSSERVNQLRHRLLNLWRNIFRYVRLFFLSVFFH